MCQSKWKNRTILKYADDTVIVSELQGNESSHHPIIDDFIMWCEESYLQLNLPKTKYMIIDFRRKSPST